MPDAIELNSNQMDESDEFETNALSDRQKYKIVMPILVKIGNLISCHSTNQFYQYLDGLGKFEKKIRSGQRLNPLRKRS